MIGRVWRRMLGFGRGDRCSTGASSVSYRHNFLVLNIIEFYDNMRTLT